MSSVSEKDLIIRIERNPKTQNYYYSAMVMSTKVIESCVCQTLAEVFQKIEAFEAKHLNQFQNEIEYQPTNWREFAKQNRLKGL